MHGDMVRFSQIFLQCCCATIKPGKVKKYPDIFVTNRPKLPPQFYLEKNYENSLMLY